MTQLLPMGGYSLWIDRFRPDSRDRRELRVSSVTLDRNAPETDLTELARAASAAAGSKDRVAARLGHRER